MKKFIEKLSKWEARLLKILLRVGTFLQLGIGVAVILLLIFPLQVAAFKEVDGYDFVVDADTLQEGEVIPIKIDYCLYYKGRADFTYRIIGENKFTYPELSVNVKKGCGVSEPRTLSIPYGQLPPGQYYLQLDVKYIVNPFKQPEKDWRSNPFFIE
jgi:hypothetical protein